LFLLKDVSTNRDECSGVDWRLAPIEVRGKLIEEIVSTI